jgi:hypothetical protein
VQTPSAPSREQACREIAAAGSLVEVARVASLALSTWRRQWGDPLEPAEACAKAWLASSFPVACASTVEFGGGFSMPSAALLDAGLDSAKSLAVSLLRKPGESESYGEGLRSTLDGAFRSLASVAWRSKQEGGASSGSLARTFDGYALTGSAARKLESMMETPPEATWGSWEKLERELGADRPWSESDAAEAIESVRALTRRFGFASVRLGCAGGPQAMASASREMLRSCESFAKTLGLGEMAVGLGGVSCEISDASVEGVDEKQSAAWFSGDFCMRFYGGARMSTVAHEWTHALDWLCDRDPSLARGREAREAIFAALSPQGREAGVLNLRHLGQIEGAAALAARGDPARAGEQEKVVGWLARERAWQGAIAASGSNWFASWGRRLDELEARESPYWSDPREMLARAAEDFFESRSVAEELNAAAGISDPGSMLDELGRLSWNLERYPQADEALAARVAFRKWLDLCEAPIIARAIVISKADGSADLTEKLVRRRVGKEVPNAIGKCGKQESRLAG